jgi:membrane-associated phospholipid phosphatase
MFGLPFLFKKLVVVFILLLTVYDSFAQESDSLSKKVYDINYSIDVPVTVVGIGTALWGLSMVTGKSPLDSATILGLDPMDVNRFDRSATWQDAGFAPTARTISDVSLAVSNALPFFLFLDKKIRRDWAGILHLFFETQALSGNLYSWGGAVHVDRIRPMVYNPDVAWEKKTEARNKNSFYSGHTSMASSACFFAAKVYCDYHPELGKKKLLVYSLAFIPVATTGIFRYKGLKHFPTDVITGLIVGAGAGILVPHLHKRTKPNLSVVPFAGPVNGLAFSYKF